MILDRRGRAISHAVDTRCLGGRIHHSHELARLPRRLPFRSDGAGLAKPRGPYKAWAASPKLQRCPFALWFVAHEPNKLDVVNRFADLSFAHVMGTDPIGRDLFGRAAGDRHLYRSIWPTIIVGLTLSAATLGFTLFGKALRDAVDPKLRARST